MYIYSHTQSLVSVSVSVQKPAAALMSTLLFCIHKHTHIRVRVHLSMFVYLFPHRVLHMIDERPLNTVDIIFHILIAQIIENRFLFFISCHFPFIRQSCGSFQSMLLQTSSSIIRARRLRRRHTPSLPLPLPLPLSLSLTHSPLSPSSQLHTSLPHRLPSVT